MMLPLTQRINPIPIRSLDDSQPRQQTGENEDVTRLALAQDCVEPRQLGVAVVGPHLSMTVEEPVKL